MRGGAKRFIPLIWQAVFILLPVALLSAVSLISLRGDAQRTEKDAQNRATQDVQSLAAAMRASANVELQRFLVLENVWTTGVRLAGQPSVTGVFPDDKLKSDITKWERSYPGLKIVDLATSQGAILADGQPIDPPQMPAVPTPPQWFRALSPGQRELWERLRRTVAAKESIGSIEKATEAFTGSRPPDSAETAAMFLREPATTIIGYSNSHPSETGLSFEELGCYQLLSAKDAKLTDSLVQSVWWRVIDNPSLISARLLEMTEGLTNQAGPVLSRKVYWMRQYWNEQSKARTWLNQILELPALTNWDIGTSWAAWAGAPEADSLALFQPCTFASYDIDQQGPLTGRGYTVWFVPRDVVQAIFTRALQEDRVIIPDYETAAVTVEDNPILSSIPPPVSDNSPFAHSVEKPSPKDSPDWQLLGIASQKAGTVAMPDAVAFSVNLYLTNRAQMLSAEGRRFRLFAMLILGAVFSAFVGLLATWRAFYRQQELSEMKINFVSSVSHELRAPIASVRLMAENLERGKIPDAPRQNEYFRFIVQECRRLSSLIENVLDFSRIEQGRKQYEFEPANLVAIVQTTVKLLEPYAAEKGVRLEIADAGTLSIELDVDGQAIQQALVNLIDNAIKHSPKGETVTVGIERLLTRPALFLVVTDHGPGIPPEEHEKIFERFYRRGSELRRETQGIGIGLSVVQHIAEAHGGHVQVQSEPGKGSRFIIELPMKDQHE